jgi:hypothetical protein
MGSTYIDDLQAPEGPKCWCDPAHNFARRILSGQADFKRRVDKAEERLDLCKNCNSLDFKAVFTFPGCTTGDHGITVSALNYLFPGKDEERIPYSMC